MNEYPLSFYLKFVIHFMTYIISEAVVMVSTLQSLGIDVSDYCKKYHFLLLDSDPLANPLLSIGILNFVLIFMTIWYVLKREYIHVDDVDASDKVKMRRMIDNKI